MLDVDHKKVICYATDGSENTTFIRGREYAQDSNMSFVFDAANKFIRRDGNNAE